MHRADRRPFVADEGWRREPPPPPPGGEIPPLTEEEMAELVELQKQANTLLAAILQEFKEQTQQGYVYNRTVPVTGLVRVPIDFTPPLFSLAITNDGAAAIQYQIPLTSSGLVVLNPTEVHTYNFVKGLIKSITMICPAPAATASVRLVGTY